MPGPGAVIFYPQAAFIRGSMIPLGERTPSPVTGRGERDSGVITWIPSIGWWYCCSLPLVDIGSCLPRHKGQDHSCFLQAISSGTAKCAPTELGLMSLPLFPLYPSLSRLPPVNYIDIMETGQRPPTRFPPAPPAPLGGLWHCRADHHAVRPPFLPTQPPTNCTAPSREGSF